MDAYSHPDDRPDPLPLAFPLLSSLPSAADMHPLHPLPGYTLMVAGQRSGKTAFLRLLLDTSSISHTATQDQLNNLAKFVQGSAGHTAHVRTVAVNVEPEPTQTEQRGPFTLTLVDTPSLDSRDEMGSERTIQDILRHVDSRFMESIDDVCTS